MQYIMTLNQSYFMCLFFFISGFFSPGSLDRKGAVGGGINAQPRRATAVSRPQLSSLSPPPPRTRPPARPGQFLFLKDKFHRLGWPFLAAVYVVMPGLNILNSQVVWGLCRASYVAASRNILPHRSSKHRTFRSATSVSTATATAPTLGRVGSCFGSW